MSARILVVDDEPAIVDLLTYNLEQAHYQVIVAHDGEDAVRKADRDQPDLVILDLMLPRLDGLEVCRAIRKERDVAIIMLTARDAEVDRVVGLELGADDYVVKPFSVRELMARVRNVLRRSQASAEPEARNTVRAGALRIDTGRHEAWWGETQLALTAQEFGLLFALASHAGWVLSREQLLGQVWGYEYYSDLRMVDAAVKRLRAKLREADPEAEPVVTVRGVGYKLLA